MAFDLSNYEPVELRISRFYGIHSNGRITTDLISFDEKQFIVKAFVFRDAADTFPAATGYAEERIGSSPVNRTSALENCETSAIGRALANLNFAPKGARPSAEEMQKVNNSYDPKNYKPVSRDNDATEKQIAFVKSICEDAFVSSGMRENVDRWNYVTEWIGSPRPIAGPQHLSKMECVRIINDKMKGAATTELMKFLQSKQPAGYDAWATPTNKEVN
jgi:hypothetical protein